MKEEAAGTTKVQYVAQKKTTLCRYYHSKNDTGEIARTCAYGDRCNFVHEIQDWNTPRMGPSEWGPTTGPNWTGFNPGWAMAAGVPTGAEEPNTPMLGR